MITACVNLKINKNLFLITRKETQKNSILQNFQHKSLKMDVNRAKQGFCSLFGLLSLSITLYSIVKFVLFVSSVTPANNGVTLSQTDELKFAIRALFSNSIWLILFILHHSFGKHEAVQKFWQKIGLKTLERAAYNIISSFVLLQMVDRWIIVDKWTLWRFNVEMYSSCWYIFVLAHSSFWLIIFGGSLLMDVPEILGIKQIYYDIKGLNHPSMYKAIQHNRLLTNVRHPSYIGFSLIFWITNMMR